MPDLQPPRTASSDEVRAVAPADWVAEVIGLYADAAPLSFDWLSACDEIGVADELRVVIRFDRNDGSGVRPRNTRVEDSSLACPLLRDVIAGVAPARAGDERVPTGSAAPRATACRCPRTPSCFRPMAHPVTRAAGHFARTSYSAPER